MITTGSPWIIHLDTIWLLYKSHDNQYHHGKLTSLLYSIISELCTIHEKETICKFTHSVGLVLAKTVPLVTGRLKLLHACIHVASFPFPVLIACSKRSKLEPRNEARYMRHELYSWNIMCRIIQHPNNKYWQLLCSLCWHVLLCRLVDVASNKWNTK